MWWAGVLADLDAQRSRAFATATPQLLDGVYAPGSPAGALDRRRVRALAAAGLRTSGLAVHVRDARPVRTGPGQVSLRVVDTLAPYRLLDAGGRVVAARPGRGERTWTVTLHLLGGRWRIAEVAAG